jgi:signal transduction histidine kinase
MRNDAVARTVRQVSKDRATTTTLAGLRQARVQQEAARRWLRRLVPVLLIIVAVTAIRSHPGPGLAGHSLGVTAALAGFALGIAGVFATFRWPGGTEIAFAVILVASSAGLMWAQPSGPGSVGVFLGVLSLAARLPGRVAVPLSAAAFTALSVIAAIIGRGPGVALLAVIGGLAGMSFLASRLGKANEQAERLLIELEHSRAAEARAAGLAERQRLAREMHDVLAHSLSGLMLQLEGARMLAADHTTSPQLAEVIDRAHHLGKTGLQEARRAIGMLRGDDLPGPERLVELAGQFSEDRGIPCRLLVSGEERKLGSEARLAVYRVAQEALTNITKHADPDRVELHLAYQPLTTRLTVEDFAAANGTRQDADGDGGYGLTGMRERAELLGGTLNTAMTPGGFRVELDLPA